MGRPAYRPIAGRPATRSRSARAQRDAAARGEKGASAGVPIFLRRGLKVNAPGDAFEREADHVAQRIASAPDRSSADSDQQHHSPAAGNAGPSNVAQALGSYGQPLDAETREFMDARFGTDLSRVRVHTGGEAGQLNHDLNAHAFTHGSDIFYGAGKAPAKDALTAHELAHVVQQSGGSRGGDGSPKLNAAEPSVQRFVKTMGGTWDTTKYDVVKNAAGTADIGLDIELNFTPEDPVNAEMIGLTQTHRAILSGSPAFPHDTAKKRSIPKGEKGMPEGTQIDQLGQFENPLYATGATAPGDTLASTATSAAWGQHGWHYTDALGAPQHQDAILKDKPALDPPGKNSSQNFETTALAVKGSQMGAYYGSVTWGWQNDASGTLTKLPLAIGSAGVPSATFMRSAELWNAGTSSTGAATLDLPTSKLPSGTTLPAARTTSDLVIEIAKANAELGAMVPGTDKTNKEFEKKAMEFELAKRADQPTISLADQEKAAALLSTPDLIKRADALPAEISGVAASSARTDKELEQEAVKREVGKRKMLITVHVHETEDVIGSDSVYVSAWSGFLRARTSVVDLNNGNEHTFVVPLSSLFYGPPLSKASSSLFLRAYDEDWEGDDLMFDKEWIWSALPAEETQSRDGGKYTVRIDFAQLR